MLLPNLVPNRLEAGCDEVGRGCLSGPVTAAAVILPADYANEWINDSKKLTKGNRERLTEEIKTNALAWAIGSATVEEIDEINILNASFLAMNRAIDALKVKPEFLLIDGNRFNPVYDIPYECIIKGDGKYASIAAASILAKTYRDELMANLAIEYPAYGWERNVGYPTKIHRLGIKEFGASPHHRKSFRLLPE
ncbi:ribonuclease HII [Cyclobacterium qasimii]|uniref:Ribonuclease HII n=2 Tax=Cyclobacterium qasimii TaxID=1350429 RepID=S7VFK2_9BACT|nr:ribonuclease HII [Cyclobacterium qasimii]EPR68317.1 Ribonuclease HII [Cyclobacterium qasimii M12-11B]GEO23576.1 ribonuclease HII [Cyclobacterium qasimii]